MQALFVKSSLDGAPKLDIISEHNDITIQFIVPVVDVYNQQGRAKDVAPRNIDSNLYLRRPPVTDEDSLRETDEEALNPPQEITPEVHYRMIS
nr:unnamed protein product [Spirometra erinaceieuropaei]